MPSELETIDSLQNGLQFHAMASLTNGGSVIRDLSRFRSLGTLTNFDLGSCWGAVQGWKALSHDGTNDWVSFPATPATETLGPTTVSMWVNLRSTGTSAFVTNADNGVGCFEIQGRSGTDLAIRPGASTHFPGFFSGGFFATWVHATVVFFGDAAGTAVWSFRNGTFFRASTLDGGRSFGNYPLSIGARSWLGTNVSNFSWDDCRVYSRVLSPSEIAMLALRPGIGVEDQARSRIRSSRHGRLAIASGVTITPNGLTAGAPVLGTPALTQNHATTATPPSVAAPTTGTPALTQNHAIGITPPSVGAPVLGRPTLTQNHAITATPPSVAAPTTGTPGLSQNHTLTATPPSVGAPVLGTPSLAGAGQLFPNGLTAGSPTLGTPSLTQNHATTAMPPSVGAPTTGTPGLSQNHAVVIVPPSIAAPTLGTPTLSSGGSVALTPRAPVVGSPVLGRPVLTITESAELSSSDYAFILLLDREGRDVSYINPDGSTSTFKAVVHKQKHVQRQNDYGIEEQMHRDVSFLATNARGRANVLQYAEMRIDGDRYQIEQYVRNAGRWRCTLKRVEVNEAARPNRRGRQ